MIRCHLIRKNPPVKRRRGESKENVSIIIDDTIEAVEKEIALSRDASERIAPGYMPILRAEFYDNDALLANIKKDCTFGTPLKVLDADQIAKL